MKTKTLVFIVFTMMLCALATLLTVIFNTAPSTFESIVLFYAALSGSLFGLIFLGFYFVNYWKFSLTPPWQTTLLGIRIAVLTTLLVVASLLLQASHSLNLFVFAILVVALAILELIWRRRMLKIT